MNHFFQVYFAMLLAILTLGVIVYHTNGKDG